jgi:DNA modification methylase
MTRPSKTAAPATRLEWMPIGQLQAASRNPKQHSPEIGTSIGRFGYVEPIVLDERTGRIVAGHGRREALMAMRQRGDAPPAGIRAEGDEWFVPVLRGWASRSDAEAEAYLLASNKLTEAGGWDNQMLAELLKDLGAQDALDGVGFTAEELEALLGEAGGIGAGTEGLTDPDEVPEEPTEEETYVKAGELWVLGKHRILCGDSTSAADIARVMDGAKAQLCWTDPPWNVAYGSAANHPSWKSRQIANDDLGERFPEFCQAFCKGIAAVTQPGALLYMAMSAQEWPTIHAALTATGFHWSSTIIWAKDSLVLSRKDYHTQYEPIWYGWNAEGPRLHPLEDRQQSDLWQIARPKRSDEHPTMKPVELVVRSVTNSSKAGEVVYEPFSGSGTTILACEKTGRQCRAIELEPKYVQVAIERWQAFTGQKAQRGAA